MGSVLRTSSIPLSAILLAFVCLAAPNAAHATLCQTGSGIGVHRTVTLDTQGGVRYGSSHGRNREFLKDKEVVLTFDDGPIPGPTTKVLHELDKHCAKATFFMVATMARNNARLVGKIAAKGHTVGFHSYSHKRLNQLSGKAAVSDVDKSIDIIKKAAGYNTAPFFRFPYLAENRAVNQYLAKRDFGVFAIDVDSLDYRMPNPTALVNRIMGELRRKGKGIILLHDIQRVTADGLGELLTRLHDEGYKLVHIKGRNGEDTSEPLLMADSGGTQKALSIRESQISDNLDKVAKRPRARNAVLQRPEQKIKTAKADEKSAPKTSAEKELERASFLFSQAFRKAVKKRILEKQTGNTIHKKKPVNKRTTMHKTIAQTKPVERAPKPSAFAIQFAKNKATFKKAIKRRLLVN